MKNDLCVNQFGATQYAAEYYIVLPLAGQSNGMAYGEGLPLPDSLDKPDPGVMQLARRMTTAPGGARCGYNALIVADHCLHDVQDMSTYHHPLADLSKGEYGCVGQGLHIAKMLRNHLPSHVGVLLVPCCRGGSAFTQGEYGSFSPAAGASSDAARWGVDTPLYQDLVSRTKAALDMNPRNLLAGVCWMQGEFDLLSAEYQKQPLLFNKMLQAFRNELIPYATQCLQHSAESVPWFCGDTTYYWRDNYPRAYDCVYGNYKRRSQEQVFFIDFSAEKIATNEPREDPDDEKTGYLGAAYRTKENWTTELRSSHFSSQARRGIIARRFAAAINDVCKLAEIV